MKNVIDIRDFRAKKLPNYYRSFPEPLFRELPASKQWFQSVTCATIHWLHFYCHWHLLFASSFTWHSLCMLKLEIWEKISSFARIFKHVLIHTEKHSLRFFKHFWLFTPQTPKISVRRIIAEIIATQTITLTDQRQSHPSLSFQVLNAFYLHINVILFLFFYVLKSFADNLLPLNRWKKKLEQHTLMSR